MVKKDALDVPLAKGECEFISPGKRGLFLVPCKLFPNPGHEDHYCSECGNDTLPASEYPCVECLIHMSSSIKCHFVSYIGGKSE